jgi:hypothetical protein
MLADTVNFSKKKKKKLDNVHAFVLFHVLLLSGRTVTSGIAKGKVKEGCQKKKIYCHKQANGSFSHTGIRRKDRRS